MKTNNGLFRQQKPFSRFTIHLKLWGILAFFLFLLVMSAVATYAGLVKISGYLDSSEVGNLRHSVALRDDLNKMEKQFNDAATLRDRELINSAKQDARDFDINLDSLLELDKANRSEYVALNNEFHDYYNAAVTAATLLVREEGFSQKVLESAEKVKRALPPLMAHVDSIINSKYSLFTRMISLSTKEASRIIVQEILLLSFLALIGFVLVFRTISGILKPINQLLTATRELGLGKLTIRTPVISDDEIGDLASSFNTMADKLEDDRNRLEESREKLSQLLSERDKMQQEIIRANQELRDANLLLRQADTAKSEFLASMSHELRTPLNAMINFTEQVIEDWEDIRKDEGLFKEAREMLGRVLASSKHLLDLINDLLDLAKIESGKMSLDLVSADLVEIVEDCVVSVDSLAKKKSLPLITQFGEPAYPIVCDRRKIKQVILNLLSNAIKFTDFGHVKAIIRTDHSHADLYLIEVEDTGTGIPVEYHQKIFDRFQQVDSSDSRRHAGTGLGLNLVKELVEMHGGRVEIKSERGKGSTFTVFIPREAHQPPPHSTVK